MVARTMLRRRTSGGLEMMRRGRSASSFNPAKLGPTLWQRPGDIVTTGSDVNSWASVGSVGGSFVGTGTARPQLTTLGGKSAVDFVASSSDQINAAGTTIASVLGTSSGWSCFLVIEPRSILSSNPAIYANEGWIASVGGQLWGIFTRLVTGVPHVGVYQWDGTARLAEAPISTGVAQLIQARWSGSGTPIRLRVGSSVEVTSASAGNITSGGDTLREGRAGAAGGTFADGKLAEPMLFSRALSDSEASALRRWYASRYSVTV